MHISQYTVNSPTSPDPVYYRLRPSDSRLAPLTPTSARLRPSPDEVAVIDEIQMLRDPQRGLGVDARPARSRAEEVHLCGEPAALELVQEMALCCGEEVEVRRYKRLSPLTCEETALESIQNVQPGDCIVCFSKMTSTRSPGRSVRGGFRWGAAGPNWCSDIFLIYTHPTG